ncbi:hypothetical protein [Kitasatospora sp. NPDC096140]|uniref:hypothetical protein n=1 Tax=Kitasatospora sp. NPDC096140 TaxID=3155425 RepID=UPI00332881BA
MNRLGRLEPHPTRATGSTAALTAAVKDVIATRFPGLVPYADTITAYDNLNLDAGSVALSPPAGAARAASRPGLPDSRATPS